MLASVLLTQVGHMLNDMEVGNEHVRWPVPELLSYMTEATSAIAQARPSVFYISDVIPLAPGSTQRLPDQFSKLIDIHFNVNPDGSEGVNVLTGVHDLQQAYMKADCPFYGGIQAYYRFEGSDRFYSVSPSIPAGLSYTPQVQALLMLTPQVLTSANQPIYFPDSDSQLYQGAIVDWTLYRAYSKDQESATSFERAQMHFKAFQFYVGVPQPPRQQQQQQRRAA